MTRTFLIVSLVAAWLLAVPTRSWSQTGDSPAQARPASSYSKTKAPPGTPAAGAKTSPTLSTAGGSKGTTYGPIAPRSEQPRVTTPSGQTPIRRTAADEPVREPAGGENPGKGTSPKDGIPRTKPKGGDNAPPPLAAEIAPRQPDWYPLAPERQKWTDEILQYWEGTSEQIVTFKCAFQRWEYDPAFGPKDPEVAYTFGKGIIQYAKPDKGMFKIESMIKYSAPLKANEKPQYLEQIGEQWVCDGRSIFEFDVRKKILYQRILPKEMQGQAIADGPLPFLFGAKASTIKARYWIQPIDPPKGSQGAYWLEAVPRFARDAANFQKVSIVLDEKDFLPKALDVYAPNYNRRTNPAHTSYAFDKRETTLKGDKKLLDPNLLLFWKKQFYEPAVPGGWKKVVEDMNARPEGPPPAQRPAPGTATRPGATKTKTK